MALRGSFDSLAGRFDRRRFLIGALGSGVALANASRIFGATEFWNAKDPSSWTEEEIILITSKSPWAREAVATIKHTDDPTANTEGGPRGGGRGARPDRIIVRWESAQPILDALRSPFPADFEGHYVVSVTNLPLAPRRRTPPGVEAAPDDTLDRMQSGTTLQVKGRDPAEAGFARRTHIASILFGFSKDVLRLTPNDREILFTLDTEILTLKTKFDGKDMIYHGKMAV